MGHRCRGTAVEIVAEVGCGPRCCGDCPSSVMPRARSREPPTARERLARLSAATPAARSGLDHSPSHVRLAGPDVAPDESGTAAAVSWTWISPTRRSSMAANWSGPAARRPCPMRMRAPSMTRRAAPSSRRPGARPIRWARPGCSFVLSPREARAWRRAVAPRSHRRRRAVDGSSGRVISGYRTRTRSRERSVSGVRRRSGSCAASATLPAAARSTGPAPASRTKTSSGRRRR